MLRIWQDDPYSGSPLSQDTSFDSPLVFKLNATGGTIADVPLWLRHDELSGEQLESSYGVVLTVDSDGSSDPAWITLAEDVSGSPGTYGSSITFGDVLGGQIIPFWISITVPSTPDIGAREDLYLSLNADSVPHSIDVNLRTGTFTNTAYNLETQALEFDVANSSGLWLSEWIDISDVESFSYSEYTTTGSIVVISYRTSTDASDATATAWVGSTAELNNAHSYAQVRVEFFANSIVGTTGLVRKIYGNLQFVNEKNTTVGGVMPTSTTPGDSFPAPKSIKWTGFFNATVAGLYTFRVVSNDGHRLYVGGQLVCENWITTVGNATTTSSGSTNLSVGWHAFEMHYYHSDGTNTISTFVDPPNTAERGIALSDFSPTDRIISLNYLRLHNNGPGALRFDVLIYDGPDVPELIDPPNGYSTAIFSPDLTVYQHNCEYVEFQMDTDSTFATGNLVQWIEPCTPESLVTSNAPAGARPPGVWYWRARGILNGFYSAWSDWRFFTIQALVSNASFLYLNVNNGLALVDPIEQGRFLYKNVNVGLKTHDPIEDARFLYLNVNVAIAIGKIIYPMYDDTPTRKSDFAEDAEFLDPELD